VFPLAAIFGLAAQLLSQRGAEALGELELTSGLGRKLYSLADDEGVINSRESLAAGANSVLLSYPTVVKPCDFDPVASGQGGGQESTACMRSTRRLFGTRYRAMKNQ
jgi:hypothetical protein